MNKLALICKTILQKNTVTQRELAAALKLSLGTVNKLMGQCLELGYIEVLPEGYRLTWEGFHFMEEFKVDNAIILAAGFGSRFVPLTFDTPKGLLEVFGEPMIERQIKQLHEAGIKEITIVVGYLKEHFEYLIDKYEVNLLYNPEYSHKNTLATVYHVRHLLHNTYLLSSDNWMRENMYDSYEAGSWYSAAYVEGNTSEWCLTTDKKNRITSIQVGGKDSYVMYGPAYFTNDLSKKLVTLLEQYYERPGTEGFYWEEILKDSIKDLRIYLNPQPKNQVYEFENLEELRLFDTSYQTNSNHVALECISEIFQVAQKDITGIQCLKEGMTNNSFLFTIGSNEYIFRLPGQGTDALINRAQEKASYDALSSLDITENIFYFNGNTGHKIAQYYSNSRNANAKKKEDIDACMRLLKRFHDAKLPVKHSFDIRERIDFYEALCKSKNWIPFNDYQEIRVHMNILMDYLDTLTVTKTLSHIDSVPDNFLILEDGSLRLIDWEYSGMCDPLIDLSMWAIYAYYNEAETDYLMKAYFGRIPNFEERIRVYAYMALGGFLWALWSAYKASFGEEFGEYIITMYRYAKKYSKIIQTMLK